jgi:uncharacterized membrane protein YtjA (UPF0391 family)
MRVSIGFLCSGRGGLPLALALASKGGSIMLHYALVFFVVALIAAVLGFRGVAGMSAQFGYLFAVIAVVLAVVSLIGSGLGGRVGP